MTAIVLCYLDSKFAREDAAAETLARLARKLGGA